MHCGHGNTVSTTLSRTPESPHKCEIRAAAEMVRTFLGLGLHFGMDFDRGWSRRSDLVWTYIEHNQYKYSFSILFSRLRVRKHRSCLPLPSWSPTVLAGTRYEQQIAPARLPADRRIPVVWTNIEHRRPDRPWYGLVSNLAPPLARFGMDLYLTSVRAFRGPERAKSHMQIFETFRNGAFGCS